MEKIDTLKLLNVINRLEIGPANVQKRRIIAPYKVIQNGETDSLNLEYSFEEDVFDPDDKMSINLANIITAQVALNYGLFCDEIIFYGIFDKVDQKFINDMAANTAREIFVKKFLEHNPFLQSEATAIPPVKLDRYLQAKLVFNTETPLYEVDKSFNRDVDRSRCAILSSGGKDSLLSYSLMKELGYETHPIFINESGRHWFTALNAYRYFRNNYPETARVWTNSDRIFSWMLRHLPFVRKDFARLRSDEYPIRLWTVAVFLFGALPLLQKRGIGRIIIGDEYDTTRRLSHRGITHYGGLYDQSRYFDNALTHYFARKKWNIHQFSIIRSLSEMLIEKILAKRYPEHQKYQMSCHAAHIQGEHVYPCGYCEKCRRIVGMLTAMRVDPRHCGYTQQQIDNCLDTIAKKGVYQESAGAQHLYFLLKTRGLINVKKNIQPHHEIMKIRIDPERSPIDEIPQELRKSLFEIFVQYAEGSLIKEERGWKDFDILSSPELS